jgi:hypothetical protein
MTGEPLSVSVTELRRSVDVLLGHIEAQVGDGPVVLDTDYFWAVPAAELYDVAEAPGNLTIGQLSESWQHVRDLLADQSHAVGYHLVWLADVLRAIGHGLPG